MTGKSFENNNPKITLNKLNIYPAYIAKHTLNHEKQIIILMIPNREGFYCLAVKKLFILLSILSILLVPKLHVGDFYCLNCLHLFRTKNKLQYHKKSVQKERIFKVLYCLPKTLRY